MTPDTQVLWYLPLLLLAVSVVWCAAGTGHSANRLIDEKSPYLLQHAHNPVDWYPWGEEAFDAAWAADRPIFLSIGYSTCHWCHVMAKESFEDEEIARLLNGAFICIKVDREERPDIDGIYMDAAMLMTGRGGWPLTILMTPEGKPFFAATYIPRESRLGMIGMRELIPRVSDMWSAQREDVISTAGRVTESLQQMGTREPTGEPSEEHMHAAFRQLAGSFDTESGGFGAAPKFPMPHNLSFLLSYWNRTGDARALEMAETTLKAMRRGGIYDHVGFGFHRYSTDADWLLPHFEKMLYDQALLAIVYADAYLATGDDEYARTTREILTYVLRDMTDAKGGFYSAEDADSDGVEGGFYVWTRDEIERLTPDADLVADAFGVLPNGNVQLDGHEHAEGANVLHMTRPWHVVATQRGTSPTAIAADWERSRRSLFAAREGRGRPHLDDKVLADWNGLMIAALARAGRALDEPDYTRAAERAASFVLTEMRDGLLQHRYRDGDAALEASADDYAFMVWGLLELYESTFDTAHLEHALELNEELIARFWNEEGGGFYFTPSDAENLVVRRMETYDGSIPSANSVAMQNLLRLGHITGRSDLMERAAALARTFTAGLDRNAAAYTQFLTALDLALGPVSEPE